MTIPTPPAGWQLNRRATTLVDAMIARSHDLKIATTWENGEARIVDCGVTAHGGLEAGRRLAEICLAGLAKVSISAGDSSLWAGPWVTVSTDHPIPACMASQYAGWQITADKYFAMGSGPMRAAGSREPLFDEIGCRETYPTVVGVLEGKLPTPQAAQIIADACQIAKSSLTLCVARTKSIAGGVQVVARSVETALHKLHSMGYHLDRVRAGFGTAPLPPPAKDDMASIGRTNDAVLYGGSVTLYVADTDETLAELTPKVPSSASRDYGRPFGEVFAAANYDFYKIDGALFSPAKVTLINLATGTTFAAGETNASVLRKSFGIA